jgi:hypothetical protein
MHVPAAVDHQQLPGDEGGGVGGPARLMGWTWRERWSSSAVVTPSAIHACTPSVRVRPVATALTVMASSPTSAASALVNPTSAALLVTECSRCLAPDSQLVEERLMMRPAGARRSHG